MRAEGIQSKLTFSFIIIQNTQRMLILSLFMKFFNKPFLASFQYTINYTIYNQLYFFIPVYLTYFFVCVKQLHKYNFVNLSHFNDFINKFYNKYYTYRSWLFQTSNFSFDLFTINVGAAEPIMCETWHGLMCRYWQIEKIDFRKLLNYYSP